ncbi:MAG: hypothetical protein ABIH26_07850 [Candidatus Eisenbacteria bacterium]
MNPREVHEVSAELHELLGVGQPPAVALLLRTRFLSAVIPLGPAVWSAYGFDVARSLAAALAAAPARFLPGDGLPEIRRVLEEARGRPVPPHAETGGWESDTAEAFRALERAEKRASGALRFRRAGGIALPSVGRSSFEGRVLVPVVAGVRGEAASTLFQGVACGLLVPLRVRIDGMLRTAAASGPVILHGVPGPREKELREVLAGLSSLGLPAVPPLRRCLFRIDWDESAASLEGRSAELGLFLAAAAAYSALGLAGPRGWVRDRTAFTGVVEGGRVEEIDRGTLSAKVSACFHGPVDTLFVPASQRGEAEEIARRLEGPHASRRLRVRGLSSLAEAWNDPEAIARTGRSVPERAAVAARRFAMSPLLVGIAALALPVLVFLIVQQLVLERNLPVAARWEGDRIVAANARGRDTAVLEDGLIRPEIVENCTFDKIGKRLAVWDLDGDDENEILAIYRGSSTKTDRIAAFDRRGRRLWDHSAGTLGLPDDAPRTDMQWLAFYSSGSRREGSLMLIVTRRVPPRALAFVDWIDGRTGEHLGMIRNEGHIEGAFAVDVGDDSDPEYFLSATDNETSMGLLSLIRPSAFSRPERTVPAVEVPSLTEPRSLQRGLVVSIRFPLDAFSHTRAHAREVTEDRDRVFRVAVAGGGEGSLLERCILYTLDFSDPERPSLEGIQLTDVFRSIIARSHPGTSEEDLEAERDRLARGTLCLTAEGWRPIRRVGP